MTYMYGMFLNLSIMKIEIAKKDLPVLLDLIHDGREVALIKRDNNRHMIKPQKTICIADKIISRLKGAIKRSYLL